MEAASFFLPLCGYAGLGQEKDTAESPTLLLRYTNFWFVNCLQQGHAQMIKNNVKLEVVRKKKPLLQAILVLF